MKVNYVLGICITIDDPQNLGRIRAVPVTQLGVYATLSDLKIFLNNEDTKSENGKIYKPWYVVKNKNYTKIDTYLCEPFLPKNIGITPNPGQLVKILNYDDDLQASEFIGPYTIDQVTLTEEFRNVILNLQKTLKINQVLPKKGKVFMSGYQNEQILLGDNEILMRLNHINSDKTRKNTYPFIQLSQFNQSYDLVNESVTTVEPINTPIDYICQLYIDYAAKTNLNDMNFDGTMLLFNAQKITNEENKIGLTSRSYSTEKQYIDKSDDTFLVKHKIYANSITDFFTIVDDIIKSYKTNGKVKYYVDKNPDGTTASPVQTIKSDKHIITVTNNIGNEPNSGGAIGDTTHVNGLRNWFFRLAPGTDIKNYTSGVDMNTPPTGLPPTNIAMTNYREFNSLDTYINKFNTNINSYKYGLLSSTIADKKITYDKDVAKPTGNPQSTQISYSDKFLFLSSLTSPSLVDDFNTDGIPSQKISEYLNNKNKNVKTYGWVRGEKLIDLLIKIIDIFDEHGHEIGKDARFSNIQITKDKVKGIKKELLDEKTQNQNNVMINHNLRFN